MKSLTKIHSHPQEYKSAFVAKGVTGGPVLKDLFKIVHVHPLRLYCTFLSVWAGSLCPKCHLSVYPSLIRANQQNSAELLQGPAQARDWLCIFWWGKPLTEVSAPPLTWMQRPVGECSFHVCSLPSQVQGLAPVYHYFFISFTHLFIYLFNNLYTMQLMISGLQGHFFDTRVPKDTVLLSFGHWPNYRSF